MKFHGSIFDIEITGKCLIKNGILLLIIQYSWDVNSTSVLIVERLGLVVTLYLLFGVGLFLKDSFCLDIKLQTLTTFFKGHYWH